MMIAQNIGGQEKYVLMLALTCILSPGEGIFALADFRIICTPVRPIQRLDSRIVRQPFLLLLGGEGRDEGERCH